MDTAGQWILGAGNGSEVARAARTHARATAGAQININQGCDVVTRDPRAGLAYGGQGCCRQRQSGCSSYGFEQRSAL